MRGQNFFQGGAARPLETGDRLTPEIFGSPEIFRSYRRKYSALIGLPKILRNLIYLSSILFWKSESVGGWRVGYGYPSTSPSPIVERSCCMQSYFSITYLLYFTIIMSVNYFLGNLVNNNNQVSIDNL